MSKYLLDVNVVDSYASTNQDGIQAIGASNAERIGQSFTPSESGTLDSAMFMIGRNASTGTSPVQVKIYAHSGTYGTSSLATGTALATSDSVLPSVIGTSLAPYTFIFSGTNRISLTGGTQYVVTIEKLADGLGLGINVGYDTTSPTHSGNFSLYDSGWVANATVDTVFAVYTANTTSAYLLEDGTTPVYYFDGHTSITDPNSNWTNDANAFDGSIATQATPAASSNTTTGYLYGQGTTAPATDSTTISSVSARLYGTSATLGQKARAHIYTSGLGQQLSATPLASSASNSTTDWGTAVVLSAPTGGWSWSVLQNLEAKIYSDSANNPAYRVEIIVTTSNPVGNYAIDETVGVTNITSGASNAVASSYTIPAVTIQPNMLYLTSIMVRNNNSLTPTTPTLTQTGMTWTLVNSVNYDDTSTSRKSVFTFRGVPSAITFAAITVDFAGQSETDCLWIIDQISGADIDGTNGSNAIVQSVTNFIDTDTNTSLSVSMATFLNANNIAYGVFANGTETAVFSPGTGFTTSALQVAGDTNGSLFTEYKQANVTSVDVTQSGASNLGGIGFGIKANYQAASTGTTITKTQSAIAQIAINRTATQPATARISKSLTKPQTAISRIANTRTLPQSAISRISNTVTRTQPVISRIATNRTLTQSAKANIITNTAVSKTQPATARIATTRSNTQAAIARLSQNFTKTQGAISRISNTRTLTQPATARIAKTVTKTQSATARITVPLTKTQSAVSRISNTGTKTQPAVSRIATNRTLTQPATARIITNTAVAKTQGAIARIATNRSSTQSAVSRIAQNFTKTQTGISRISNSRTLTQPAVSRIAKNLTKVQPSVSRIANTIAKTQPAVGRIATNVTKTQPAVSRISQSYTKTQPVVSRVAKNVTKTQSATANITVNGAQSKTQPAIARIATNRSNTQSAVSRIAQNYTKTQSAVSRISKTFTLTQPATARVAKTVVKTQSAIGRIATSNTKTQSAISRLSNTVTKTQPVIARVATNRTKTQTATANIVVNGTQLAKTQTATSRIAVNRSNTQSATGRIARNLTTTQTAVSRISKSFTKTQAATSRIANTRTLTQTATASITAILIRTKVQPATGRIASNRSNTQTATARILHYDYTFTPDVPSSASTWTPDVNGTSSFTPETPTAGATWVVDSIGTGTVNPSGTVGAGSWTPEG